MEISIDASCVKALSAAEEAGRAIIEVYESDFNVDYKDDKSPLTKADKRSHEIISGRLSGTMPILSEEGKDISYEERKKWKYFWLVDPLDGTKEFIKRNGEFTVNIALIQGDAPIMGVVYAPVKGIFYFAVKGSGAYKMQGNKISATLDKVFSTSVRLPLIHSAARYSGPTIIGSRSHSTKEQEDFIKEMEKKYGEIDFISAGSSLKFCLIAEGMADIYPRFGPTMEWDTAAGQCLVEESGGRVVSIPDKLPFSYNKEDLRNGPFMCLGKNAEVFCEGSDTL